MRLIRNVLRFYSYAFETFLCAGGILLSGFTAASPNVQVKVPWLPGTESSQVGWIFALAIVGLLAVGLALLGRARLLLLVFSALVLGLLVKGFFLNTTYTFATHGDVKNALIFVVAAGIAVIGAIPMARRVRRS